jgi:hypothetical protein
LDTDILFGRVGKQAGILELLGQGTLLLDHVKVLGSSDRTRLLSLSQNRLHPFTQGSLLRNLPHLLLLIGLTWICFWLMI